MNTTSSIVYVLGTEDLESKKTRYIKVAKNGSIRSTFDSTKATLFVRKDDARNFQALVERRGENTLSVLRVDVSWQVGVDAEARARVGRTTAPLEKMYDLRNNMRKRSRELQESALVIDRIIAKAETDRVRSVSTTKIAALR